MKTIYHDTVSYNNHVIDVYASEQGLLFVGSYDQQNEIHAFFSEIEIQTNTEKMKPYTDQLQEYFNGERYTFDLKLDIDATAFNQQVWEALQTIPYGETTTYSDIAERINNPKAVRAVASAIGKNPLTIVVPCHRVIGKDGQLRGYRGGLEMKQSLLSLEQ
ncbi:methylated-DNA--[protein]-cysteine S-methyltransferase [Mammaliicoccus sp. Dog046]|uniref:methylated-DNA--[protein]-cysteine S-methyltransferase n=1 Tax=Mammaliicoccus sp. Dog046 TaxID=3034233 RepID=UPI002B26140E|nr:methylated-DNA--[protein]-cysteine S-methyltransferase [Mammaliicoccus sp. Dog046]WQK84536.1 methylated-DNA--[protein]-cysteine S-methyltransferase [Mammaliicoccus sp. Dog046]